MADEDTFELTLAGRPITFRKTVQGQVVALQRVVTRLRGQLATLPDGDDEAHNELLTKINTTILDVAESRFTSAEDRDFVEQKMLMGEIDIFDMMDIFRNGAAKPAQIPDDAPAPARKTAAKKATAKKATAKKAANGNRTRR